MTVKELIEKLQTMPQDLRVAMIDPGCGCCSSGELIDVDAKVDQETKLVYATDGVQCHIEVVGEYVDIS